MKRGFAILVALLLVTAVSATAFGEAFVVDDFTSTTDPSGSWSVSLGTTTGTSVVSNTFTETSLSGVAGGSRTTVITSHPNPNTDGVSVTMTASPGVINMDSIGSGLGQLQLMYANMGADVSGQQYVNVSMDINHVANGAPTSMSVTLSDGTYTSTVSKVWTTPAGISGAYQDYKFDMSDFLAANASLDLTSIQTLKFEFLGDEGACASIDSITIPEPATIVLLGLGAVTLIKRRK